MLFGVHVYSRAKVVPDLALSRGEDAYRAARLQGDRTIEFLAAGGVAMGLLELGDVDGAERWLDKAAAAISTAPSPEPLHPARDVAREVRAGAGDAEGMRSHLEKAVAIATEAGQASARCEALARLAVEAARLVANDATDEVRPDPALVELVERSAAQVKDAMPLLPGHAPWGAQADAALATVALARGDTEGAAMLGGAALAGPPGRAPRGHQPGDPHPRGARGLGRRSAGGPGVRPRPTSGRRCRGSPRARPTNRSASGG